MRDERRRLIDEILAIDRGIWGVEVCQLCGELGDFGGWAGAMASHPGGEFVALGHKHGDIGSLAALLDASEARWCAWCARSVPRDPRAGREPRLCEACVRDGRVAQLGREVRLRWLDRRDTGALREIRDDYERAVALDGTAPSQELARVRLVARRAMRRLGRR